MTCYVSGTMGNERWVGLKLEFDFSRPRAKKKNGRLNIRICVSISKFTHLLQGFNPLT